MTTAADDHIQAMARQLAAPGRLDAIRQRNHRLFHEGYTDGGGEFHEPRRYEACLVCTGELPRA